MTDAVPDQRFVKKLGPVINIEAAQCEWQAAAQLIDRLDDERTLAH